MTLEKLRIAVVRGGNTPRYESSLASGQTVLKALRENEALFSPVDIFVDRSGIWHVMGLPTDPERALKHVQAVWNTSDAAYSEGRLEQYLESVRIPYVGSGAVSAALAESIRHSREIYAREKLPTVRYELLRADAHDDADLVRIFRSFLMPVAVRSEHKDPKLGSAFAHTYAELEAAVKSAFVHGTHVVVEEYMKGKQALAGVLESARGEKRYAFLPAEMRASGAVAPGNFSPEEKRRMEELARLAHDALGLRHYSASRFLVTPKKVYILETLALPDISEGSALNKSLRATGWKERDLVEHLVDLAMKN